MSGNFTVSPTPGSVPFLDHDEQFVTSEPLVTYAIQSPLETKTSMGDNGFGHQSWPWSPVRGNTTQDTGYSEDLYQYSGNNFDFNLFSQLPKVGGSPRSYPTSLVVSPNHIDPSHTPTQLPYTDQAQQARVLGPLRGTDAGFFLNPADRAAIEVGFHMTGEEYGNHTPLQSVRKSSACQVPLLTKHHRQNLLSRKTQQ
jgi:hypothetical protein